MGVGRVVFVHGAGAAAGPEAWPLQAADPDPGWLFLARADEGDDAARDARRVLDRLEATGGGHVVAHSYGANAAILVAQQQPELVRSLALLEPACFDLARGRPSVEAHVDDMTPVFAAAEDPDVSLREFLRRFTTGMGFPPPASWDEELESNAARLRRLAPPWGAGLRPEVGVPVRTVVVTAAARALYEEVAMALASLGAVHRTLRGAGHRVQDDPRTTALLRELWSG